MLGSWFGPKKSLFQDLYIKSFNWKRKRSNSNFQVKCEYQTTTNIAFLCKMVRVPFLFCDFEIPHQKVPFRYWLPKKGSVGSWFGQKDLFLQTFTSRVLVGKENGQIQIVKLNVNTRLDTTNIAFLCKMVRVPFLLCVILEFPTRKYLSGIGSPKKMLGSWFGAKIIFWRLVHTVLNWKRKRSNSNCQVKCEYQTTTNIAFLCKMVRVPFLFCDFEIPHQIMPFRYWLLKKGSGFDLDQKKHFWTFT